MLLRDIIDLVDTKATPIHFYNMENETNLVFYSNLFTSEERNIALKEIGMPDTTGDIVESDLGVYFPDGDVEQVSALLRQQQPEVSDWIENLLDNEFRVDIENMNVALILFGVLHEIGHWQHLLNSKMNRVDYARTFYIPQARLYWERFKMISLCQCREDADKLDIVFKQKYRELDIERVADQYAMLEFALYFYDCIEKYRENR